MYTPLAHGVGAHPDVLLDLVAVGEVDVVPVQLLQGDRAERIRGLGDAHGAATRGRPDGDQGRGRWREGVL